VRGRESPKCARTKSCLFPPIFFSHGIFSDFYACKFNSPHRHREKGIISSEFLGKQSWEPKREKKEVTAESSDFNRVR